MDYSTTVNLPRTSFPMSGELLERQEGMLRHWQAQDIYRSMLEDRRDARPFVIHDGPPYASGQIHVGIGMNKIIKDIIAKYYSMNDRRVPFVPGWDCHGLPIEVEVRRELGEQQSEAIPVAEFRDHCAKFALHYIREQKRQFQLLGIFADWDRPYLTMNPSYEAGVLTVLVDMVEKGYVYRDHRPIAWCAHCQTSLAEAEIEYRKEPERSVWIHFEGGPELARRFGAREDIPCTLLVWTTSSWSLPGSAAVAARPDFNYAAFEHEGDGGRRTTVVLEGLAREAFGALGVTDYARTGTVAGQELEGSEVRHPLDGRMVPVIMADFIRGDSGSGFVHIVPGHGLDDLEAAGRYGLDGPSIVDARGRFTADAGEFEETRTTAGARACSSRRRRKRFR